MYTIEWNCNSLRFIRFLLKTKVISITYTTNKMSNFRFGWYTRTVSFLLDTYLLGELKDCWMVSLSWRVFFKVAFMSAFYNRFCKKNMNDFYYLPTIMVHQRNQGSTKLDSLLKEHSDCLFCVVVYSTIRQFVSCVRS